MWNTVLFDLDGTLLNTAEGITAGVSYALDKHGLPPLPYHIRERFIGPPLRVCFQKYCGVDAETSEALLKTYRVFYSKEGMHMAKPYQGMPPLLKKLRRAGKALLVATSKPTPYATEMLREWHMAEDFYQIVGAGFDKNSETKEKIVATAKRLAGGNAAVMVGDTVYDVWGARENAMPCIGVLYGFGDPAEMRAAKPDYLAETVEELEKILLPL